MGVSLSADKNRPDPFYTRSHFLYPQFYCRFSDAGRWQDVWDADAKEKAAALINEATVHTNELINEHEIMQQAYAQANAVVEAATVQAQEILNNAAADANEIRMGAMQYTDSMLANMQSIIAQSMEGAAFRYEQLMTGLNNCYETVKANRAELFPMAGLEDLEEGIVAEQKGIDVI